MEHLKYLITPSIIVLLLAIIITIYTDFHKLKGKKKNLSNIKAFLPTIATLLVLIATIISTIDDEKTKNEIISNLTGGDSLAYLSVDVRDNIISFDLMKKGHDPLYDVRILITNTTLQNSYLSGKIKIPDRVTSKEEVKNIEKMIEDTVMNSIKMATKEFQIGNLDINDGNKGTLYKVNFPEELNETNFHINIKAKNGVVTQIININRCLTKSKEGEERFATDNIITKEEKLLRSFKISCN